MGFLFLYLNALKEKRLATFNFLLSLQHHVLRNDNAPSGLPAKFHQNFTSSIGDVVLYYVKKFRKEVTLTAKVEHILKILKFEDSSGLSDARDSVLRAANGQIIKHNSRVFVTPTDSRRFYPFTSSSSDLIEDVRHYLLSIVEDIDKDSPKIPSLADDLKNSLLSPAMMEIRNFVDFYGLDLKNDDSESFLKFFGCVCVLLLEVAGLVKNELIFYILGEAERVLNKFEETTPSFEDMDNYAKSLLSIENSSEEHNKDDYPSKSLPIVDLKLEECLNTLP